MKKRKAEAGPDYKNWTPAQSIVICSAGVLLSFALLIFSLMKKRHRMSFLMGILTALFGVYDSLLISWHMAFSWKGKKKLSRAIIEGTASHINLPDGGIGLDVGCGSGALTIAVAKKNPRADMIGVDIWSGRWSEYSRKLCEKNAAAEGVSNVSFERGSAVQLPFADETFDAVTSNLVYHNIAVRDRQALLLESLRVLKKGGTFSIHDVFSPMIFGDMESFIQRLRDMGYADVRLVSSVDCGFLAERDARRLLLQHSALLYGVK